MVVSGWFSILARKDIQSRAGKDLDMMCTHCGLEDCDDALVLGHDMKWYIAIYYDIWYGVIWYDMTWYEMIWNDTIWYVALCCSTWCDVHALMSNTEHTRCYDVKRKLLSVKNELDRTKLLCDLVVTWIEHLQGTRHLDFKPFQDWKKMSNLLLSIKTKNDKDTYYSNIEQL